MNGTSEGKAALAPGLRLNSPLRELAVWLLLWPAWWLLGIEQFVPGIVLPLMVVRLLLAGHVALRRHRALLFAFALFLSMQLLSAGGIDEPRRLLTFGRSFVSWMAAFSALIIATAVPSEMGDVRKLVWILAGLVAIASAVSVAALWGFRPDGWSAPVEKLLPPSLERGDYLGQLLKRSWGREDFFQPLGDYYRVNSLFLWSLQNASAMVVTLPLIGTLTQTGKAWHKATAWSILVLGSTNLFFTTGRAAIAGLVAGGLFVLAFHSRYRRHFWWLTSLICVTLAVVLMVQVMTTGGSALLGRGADALRAVVFARGRWGGHGSPQFRSIILAESLRGWRERPFLGWGTVRSLPELSIPVGTHSTYMGILYQHGALGFAAFLAVLLLLWYSTGPTRRLLLGDQSPWPHYLLVAGRWSMVAVLVDGLTSDPAADTMALVMIWLAYGALVSAKRLSTVTQTSSTDHAAEARVLGVRVHSLREADLTRRVVELGRQRKHSLVLNVNAHCLNLAYSRPWLREMLNGAEIVFCDGAGVVLAARFLGQHIAERITYAEWMWDLATAAAQAGLSIGLLGARPGIASLAARRLRERHPELRVRALGDGYFDKEEGSLENLVVIDAINAMSPDILVVGFGMPLQERWLHHNWHRLDAGVALTGGGVFDYVSNTRKRAPAWMTEHSLEWLGRLVIEPRRLWRRYLLGNPLFVWRILTQRLGLQRWRASSSS